MLVVLYQRAKVVYIAELHKYDKPHLVWPPQHPTAAVNRHQDALGATNKPEPDKMVECAGEVGPLQRGRSGGRHLQANTVQQNIISWWCPAELQIAITPSYLFSEAMTSASFLPEASGRFLKRFLKG